LNLSLGLNFGLFLRLDSLRFSSGWALSASPQAGFSRLPLWLGSLGFSFGWALSASPQAGLSRLLLLTDGLVYLQGAPMPKLEAV